MTIRNRSQYPAQARQEFEYLDKKIRKLQLSIGFVPVGARVLWDGETAPRGWVLADGASYSRDTYHELFAVLGVTQGAGNGSTTFNVTEAAGYIIYTGVE